MPRNYEKVGGRPIALAELRKWEKEAEAMGGHLAGLLCRAIQEIRRLHGRIYCQNSDIRILEDENWKLKHGGKTK